MLLGDRGSRRRCLIVWTSGTSSLGSTAALLGAHLRDARAAGSSVGALPLDRALAELAAVALLGCAAWAWLVLTATVLEAWPGSPPERRRSGRPPRGVRRLVLAACGVALLSAAASPALATGHDHGARLLAGLPLPERPVAPRHTQGPASDRDVLVVRPGDSLWTIARRELPPGASDADVTSRWHAIYAANRALIGPDPGLIRPGQELRLPREDPS